MPGATTTSWDTGGIPVANRTSFILTTVALYPCGNQSRSISFSVNIPIGYYQAFIGDAGLLERCRRGGAGRQRAHRGVPRHAGAFAELHDRFKAGPGQNPA